MSARTLAPNELTGAHLSMHQWARASARADAGKFQLRDLSWVQIRAGWMSGLGAGWRPEGWVGVGQSAGRGRPSGHRPAGSGSRPASAAPPPSEDGDCGTNIEPQYMGPDGWECDCDTVRDHIRVTNHLDAYCGACGGSLVFDECYVSTTSYGSPWACFCTWHCEGGSSTDPCCHVQQGSTSSTTLRCGEDEPEEEPDYEVDDWLGAAISNFPWAAGAGFEESPGCGISIGKSAVWGGPFDAHTFILFRESSGLQWIYEGGPENEGFLMPGQSRGIIETTKYQDHPPQDYAGSVDVTPESGACDVESCLDYWLAEIEAQGIYHSFRGPNSNSVTYTLLAKCSLPTDPPDGSFPGWGNLLL